MIASPCTGVCKYDDATGWCLGCGRTRDEIASWGKASEVERRNVWALLPGRAAQLGVALRRPAWTEDDLREQARLRLRSGIGQWLVGVPGAVAELPLEEAEVEAQGSTLLARSPSGALRLRIDAKSQALTPTKRRRPDPSLQVVRGNTETKSRASTLEPVLFVVHRTRLAEAASGLTELGPDPDPIDAGVRAIVFDLGLGSPVARFMIRVDDDALVRALRARLGSPLDALLRTMGPELVSASPVRLVETAYARAEITSPIAPAIPPHRPTGHTHLQPGAPLLGRELPPGWELPDTYAPVALWEPHDALGPEG